MKFIVSKREFLEALSMAVKALAGKPGNPVYENILLSAFEDGIALTGSDGAVTVRSRAQTDGSDWENPVMAPGRLLMEATRRMPDGEMSVTAEGGNLTLRCQRARLSTTCLDGALYPNADAVAGEELSVSEPEMKAALGKTLRAMGRDDSRKILNGVYLEIGGGKFRATTLDGFQMAHAEFDLDCGEADWSGIVPAASARLLEGTLSPAEEKAAVRIGKNQLGIETENGRILTTLIDGAYVDYRKVIPKFEKDRPNGFSANRQRMLETLDRAKLVTRTDGNNAVRLASEENGGLRVSAMAQTCESFDVMEVSRIGEEINTAFNPDYLIGALKSLVGETVNFRQAGPMSPAILDDGSTSDWRVVLPVRVRAQ